MLPRPRRPGQPILANQDVVFITVKQLDPFLGFKHNHDSRRNSSSGRYASRKKHVQNCQCVCENNNFTMYVSQFLSSS